jgi:REP element-mobilizing transposase RayT
MANTYTQLHIHCVFAPKFRAALLLPTFDVRLRQYITAIVEKRGHKMLAINNVTDHLHLFFGLNPKESISSLMEAVKGESSRWINEQDFLPHKFIWQEGYGAFSHSRSQVDAVAKYVHNQQEHHRKETFLQEYNRMLQQFEVDYDERYIFKAPLVE